MNQNIFCKLLQTNSIEEGKIKKEAKGTSPLLLQPWSTIFLRDTQILKYTQTCEAVPHTIFFFVLGSFFDIEMLKISSNT